MYVPMLVLDTQIVTRMYEGRLRTSYGFVDIAWSSIKNSFNIFAMSFHQVQPHVKQGSSPTKKARRDGSKPLKADAQGSYLKDSENM